MDAKQTAALREVFEQWEVSENGWDKDDLRRHPDGIYHSARIHEDWSSWLACYQHLAPQLKDAARYQWLRDIDNEQEAFSAIHEFADKYLDEAIDAAIDRKNDAAREQEKKTC